MKKNRFGFREMLGLIEWIGVMNELRAFSAYNELHRVSEDGK